MSLAPSLQKRIAGKEIADTCTHNLLSHVLQYLHVTLLSSFELKLITAHQLACQLYLYPIITMFILCRKPLIMRKLLTVKLL